MSVVPKMKTKMLTNVSNDPKRHHLLPFDITDIYKLASYHNVKISSPSNRPAIETRLIIIYIFKIVKDYLAKNSIQNA